MSTACSLAMGKRENKDFKQCMSIQNEPFQCEDRLQTSESDVYRRQILTYEDGPRTERTKLFIMTVDP